MEDGIALKSKVYTVSELNLEIRKSLEKDYSLIWVEGEVSNFYFRGKKHMYFDLKDESSKINVVMFHNNNKNLIFDIEEGLHILVNGYISVYEKRGEYQIVALDARPVGKGSLILAFEQLKEKLEKKGYFDRIYKKEIPILPAKIGVATSIGGAVIRDIIQVLRYRFENFHLIVRDVNVQGSTSSDEICEAIDDLCQYGVGVIIIARGGGSLEDLWAFNTEKLAKKIFDCPIPLISAIGHETDYTISDFVSDKRAATPSIAGQLVILSKTEVVEKIKNLNKRISHLTDTKITMLKKEVNFFIKKRIFIKPETLLNRFNQTAFEFHGKLIENMKKIIRMGQENISGYRQLIDKKNIFKKIYMHKMAIRNIDARMISGIKNYLNFSKGELRLILENLKEKNPIAVMDRGFAIIYKAEEDKGVRSINEVDINQKVRIILRDGILSARIFDKIYKKLELGSGNENR